MDYLKFGAGTIVWVFIMVQILDYYRIQPYSAEEFAVLCLIPLIIMPFIALLGFVVFEYLIHEWLFMGNP